MHPLAMDLLMLPYADTPPAADHLALRLGTDPATGTPIILLEVPGPEGGPGILCAMVAAQARTIAGALLYAADQLDHHHHPEAPP